MSAVDDMFGSDSSDGEFEPKGSSDKEGASGSGGGGDEEGGSNVLEDSDMDDDNEISAPTTSSAAAALDSADLEIPQLSVPATDDSGGAIERDESAIMGGTGLSDSEEEADAAAAAERQTVDDDLFGSDSDSGGEAGPRRGGAGAAGAEDEADPFEDSDAEQGVPGRGGGGGGKTFGRLSKGGRSKGKGKKRKAGGDDDDDDDDDGDELEDSGGVGSAKKGKGKGKKGDKTKKKGKKKKKRKKGEASAGDGENGEEPAKSKKKGKKKKKKIKAKKAKGTDGGDGGGSSQLQDLGLLSSADEAEEEEEEELSGSEAELEPEEAGAPGDGGEAEGEEVRTREDDDFIDNTDDNPDLLNEYDHDAPPAGSDSEAEEDNTGDFREDLPVQESPMAAVLKSMKRRKAQDLSTAEREQIAQEFMFKINQAAEDDEEAVMGGRPALSKLKLLKVVKATLAKKELQETFLEFDLLGVVKRWLQPYSNGQLPNLTIRKEMLAILLLLPVQVDHLKRSGIGKIVMGLLNCKEETTQNKRVLRELVSRWNRPVYEKETNYRAMRSMHDEPEAMEVMPAGRRSGAGAGGAGGRRRGTGNMSQRDGASKDEAVGNILNARASGLDPTKSRVPYSIGYAFAKAPRSRVEGHGRPPPQQVDTTARTKLLKKMAVLSKPINKNA